MTLPFKIYTSGVKINFLESKSIVDNELYIVDNIDFIGNPTYRISSIPPRVVGKWKNRVPYEVYLFRVLNVMVLNPTS